MQDTIAIVFDFDDTLAPDTTWGFLEYCGLDPAGFWQEKVDPLVAGGWDPIPAYLYAMLEESKSRPAAGRITRQKLAAYGKGLALHKGVTAIFDKLSTQAASTCPEARLEFYVVSSGILEILSHTRISRRFNRIWACDFFYSPDSGEIVFPRNIISFTDKTRYLFMISKGFAGHEYDSRPFEVNRRVAREKIRVPFSRMVYVGDGYTDIPCFALIRKQKGIALGVYDPQHREKWSRAWGFVEDERVSNLLPADFSKGSALEQSLLMAVDKLAHDIAASR